MRREKWLTISRSSLGELRKGNYKNINWYTSSVPDQINNYDMWNIELVVMPYFNNEYGEGILLYNAPREARFFRTPMLIPDFLLSLDREKTINTIIALSLYLLFLRENITCRLTDCCLNFKMNCLYLSVLKRSRTYRIPMQVVGILEC